MKLKCFILFFSFCLAVGAQTGFQKYFSDPFEYQQFRYSAFDSSYVMAGARYITGTVYDFCAVKIGMDGTVLWSKTYPSLNDEFLTSLSVSPSGEILLSGYKSNSSWDNDFSLMKTDVSGNLLWHKTYGNTKMELSVFSGETTTGECFMVGNRESSNDPMVIKTNSSGNLLWSKTFGTTDGAEQADIAAITNDGGIVFAGDLQGQNTFMMKLNSAGTIQWSHSYSSLHIQLLGSVKQTSDNGFIVASTDYRCDSWGCFPFISFIKLDSSGNVSWSKAVEGYYGWGREAIETVDGGFAFVGKIQDTAGGDKQSVLIKTGSGGNFQWAMTYGKPGTYGEAFFTEQTPDGGYALFGLSNSGAHFIKTDVSGASGCYEKTITPTLSNMNFTKAGTIMLPEKNISDTVAQPVISSASFALTDSFICNTSGINDILLSQEIKIYPNPFLESATVAVESNGINEIHYFLYDIFGRIVLSGSSVSKEFEINRAGLSNGMYMLQLRVGGKTAHKKVVIQ